jgi:hypothetical protein
VTEETALPTDRQGNLLPSANVEAARCFDEAVHAFNVYRGDPVALLDEAVEHAPGFAMARIMKAHLMALATEPEATAAAKAILAEVKTLRLGEREASHVAALDHLLAGNWTRAALALDRHSMRWPRDLVALQSGHLMDFYRANARAMRDRIARALPHWAADIPGHSIVQGMYAFGLEETGDYARAEATGMAATEAEPLDCWAHHAVAHVLEMQGRPADGLRWMRTREPHWDGDDNFFKVHNWWHRALCHLELGEPGEALALYDARIRNGESGMALDLVDASALLWRLQLSAPTSAIAGNPSPPPGTPTPTAGSTPSTTGTPPWPGWVLGGPPTSSASSRPIAARAARAARSTAGPGPPAGR